MPARKPSPTLNTDAPTFVSPAAGADVAIVRRTQSALSAAGEPAVHFAARFAVPSTPALVQFLLFGAVMMTLAKWSWGRALLLK